MAYVYRHIRLDKDHVFYVGIGSDDNYDRAYSKDSRNNHWHSIVNKSDYEIEIMLDDLSWEDACKKETEFIKLYGRNDLNEGTLVNMTDGGEGLIKPSIQVKEKISKSVANHWNSLTEEQRSYKNYFSGYNVKLYNARLTKEQKELNNKKVSEGWNNRSDELKQEYAIKKSKQVSEIWKNRSEQEKLDIKRKISNSLKGSTHVDNRKTLQCPHCLKVGISSNMTRYHFDKCKINYGK